MTGSVTTEFEEAVERIKRASGYLDIFTSEDEINSVFRSLAKVVHPDVWLPNTPEMSQAEIAFKLLSTYKDQADQLVAQGRFGKPLVMATITTKRATHRIREKVGTDEMAVFYRATSVTANAGNDSMVKVARSVKDNDLFATEARALKKLHEVTDADGNPEQLTRHYPPLLDTFVHSEGRRRANVTPYYSGLHTLEYIRNVFPGGVDPRHGVWIFRRLLMALAFAHDQGLVHGAVVPSHVLIGPQDHAVILIDWCYSQVIDEESETNFIKAVVPMYKALYAPEVFDKTPASAATDLYMAATLMSYLMPVAPKPFRAFFKGTALTNPSMRPQNAWGLLREFDELLKGIGKPFHPRQWVDFVVPTGKA